ncbi:membrane integrity-associated transporter subunit PqiC [Maribius pontilimi]|uniref:Membrane integrity-associated transporter subunit PqiC n=1 Tax=Palleronia pontilimi TaxID=1964209 RepID=A0A934MB54_9RHOB|nr:ABC-type transport auxiliary lipoprotein family protein [Palleronia pontilimi]MBJ3761160.1 membrane integrity-associated transporter subunit PqiC [Palleronia pontilimi]
MTRTCLALALVLLAACGADPLRYDLPAIPETGQIPVSFASVEVRDVSLPTYAGQEVIFFQDETGALVSDDALLWADDPERAFTEGLALSLATLTRARVAAEPWPFYDNADARVEVRFSRALPENTGQYRIAGQYFVASTDGTRRETARRFDLSAPYTVASAAGIAAAKAQVINELARLIARNGL